MSELKPCPFCGGKAYFKAADELADGTFINAYCGCHACGIELWSNYKKSHWEWAKKEDFEKSNQKAREAWNMRAEWESE